MTFTQGLADDVGLRHQPAADDNEFLIELISSRWQEQENALNDAQQQLIVKDSEIKVTFVVKISVDDLMILNDFFLIRSNN